jgi:hypothetical protein
MQNFAISLNLAHSLPTFDDRQSPGSPHRLLSASADYLAKQMP